MLGRYYKGIQYYWLAIIGVVAIEFGAYEVVYENISHAFKERDVITFCFDEFAPLTLMR